MKKNPWQGVEGFFIASDGGVFQVQDHYNAIKDDPKRFGLSEGEASQYMRKDRDDLVREALRLSGYVRVRGHKTYTTFDFYELDDGTLSLIKKFVRKFAFWNDEKMRLHELSTGDSWEDDVVKLKHLTVERFRGQA